MTRGQKIAILAVIAVIVIAVVAAKNKNADTTTMARSRKGFLKGGSDSMCPCPRVPLGPDEVGKPQLSESVTIINPRGKASDAAGMLCDYIGAQECGGISYDKSDHKAMVFGKLGGGGIPRLDGDPNWTTMFAQ